MSCKYHFNWTTDAPCPYCRIDELEQDRDGWIRNFEMQERVVAIAQQRVAELEQQLAGEKKAAGYWMEQSCKDHNRAEKADQQLSRYHNLLAVAHRDGGQYLALHGEEKAGEDAITAILTAYHNNDSYQGGIEVEGVIEYDKHTDEYYMIADINCDSILVKDMWGVAKKYKRVRAHVMEVE